jgi:hypothetical protein
MKLRIKGNSLRLRLSRSELARLVQEGRVEETIRFARDNDATLTYALQCSPAQTQMSVRYEPQKVSVLLSSEEARRWSAGDQVGLESTFDIGEGQVLALLVEKDFACLSRTDADNADTFPNPNHGSVC